MRFLITFLLLIPAATSQNQPLFGFMQNSGQFPPAVQFVRYSTGLNFFYLTRDSFVLRDDLRVQLAGINTNSQPTGVAPTATIYNIYQGNDPSKWITNSHEYAGVNLGTVYPGINAEFTTSLLQLSPAPPGAAPPAFGQGAIVFRIAPNADPSVIRLNVLNIRIQPFLGPGGIWFGGGRVPGVFILSAKASQPSGGSSVALTPNLVIDSDGTLSVALPDRNPALETDLTVNFPDYDVFNQGPLSGLFASYLQYPLDLNEDGAISDPGCANECQRAVIASADSQGNPMWVTVLGGSGMDEAFFATADQGGVAVSGTTSSSDFPVSTSAPVTKPGSSNDVWLGYLNAANGQWIDGTYAGLPEPAFLTGHVVDPGGDVVAGMILSSSHGSVGTGVLLRWRPSENRFIYSVSLPSLPVKLLLDANSNLYFAELNPGNTATTITVGELNPGGETVGMPVSIGAPPGMSEVYAILLQPAGGTVWVAYAARTPMSAVGPAARLARVSLSTGQVLLNNPLAQSGQPDNIGITPPGNLKVLVSAPSPDEAVTQDAALVGECLNTSYFAVLSPSGQLVYGTYVYDSGFDFSAQNESTGPPAVSIGCLASAANRVPSGAVAPGELITLIGGGFGPTMPLVIVPQADGTYPATAGGFSVTIAGMNAPILAVMRGAIVAQVPYELANLAGQSGTVAVQAFQNGQPLNAIATSMTSNLFNLFDTGNRDNALNLPALVALNQDGTVNAPSNPAPVGTIVSLFGTGVGVLSPPLATGALNPIPPSGPLSVTSLYNACSGCASVLYLGSAPGLSTGIQQINIQLPANVSGTGVRPLGINVVVSPTLRNLFVFDLAGVVFVE